jgi:alkanesulfonate monooxygenase SsuD/methylene tetrahydromethanopterin reductase-like flavin-dependent oxidoreductase (luciferase family)
MKKIGFLSVGHWTPSQTQTAADALLQCIDRAVEAERLGVDGAYFRVHHCRIDPEMGTQEYRTNSD